MNSQQCMNEVLSCELVAMADEDFAVRDELVADGSLAIHGYHPRMEAVHKKNAARLAAIIEQHGWPIISLVGEKGAWAAWLIAQHDIGEPAFMRQCLALLKRAAENKEIEPWQVAMMEDRIRIFEGKQQVYGTQFEPNAQGEFVPYPIEDLAGVNERRLEVGLNTLEERAAEMNAQRASENVPMPPDAETQYLKWVYAVGWRS
ncbi:MAG: hypothetical protein HOP24_01365 [Sideroxydans sp.]|nr:hypothetical protein [Sideroxydans sp.]